MAARLIEAGHAVTGCDLQEAALRRLAERGGQPARSPAAACADASVVILMVHDAAQVDAVLFQADTGVLAGLRAGAIVWLASTVKPAYAIELGRRLAERGIRFIDGPVSGGMTGAQAGELTVMAGGDAQAIEEALPLMRACATHVHHVGGVGTGSTVKMVNQLLVASHIALAAESLALAQSAGVDLPQLVEVIGHSAGHSRMFGKRAPRMVQDEHTPHATVRVFLKDLAIALDAAREHAVPTPMTTAAHQVFNLAAGAGFAEQSDTRLFDLYRQSNAGLSPSPAPAT